MNPLAQLREKFDQIPCFAHWRAFRGEDEATIAAVEEAMRDALDDLLIAQKEGLLDDALIAERLIIAIEDLNDIDAEGDPFIETLEREDLCDLLYAMAKAAGFSDMELFVEIMNKHREW